MRHYDFVHLHNHLRFPVVWTFAVTSFLGCSLCLRLRRGHAERDLKISGPLTPTRNPITVRFTQVGPSNLITYFFPPPSIVVPPPSLEMFTLSLPTIVTLFLSSFAAVRASPCVAFDTNWNLLAFGLDGKDWNAGTQGTWATGASFFRSHPFV